MNLKHLGVPKSKEVLRKKWGLVERAWVPVRKGSLLAIMIALDYNL